MDNTGAGTAVALETVGCKLNQAETASLARQFVAAGYRLADSVEDADVYVLNTCTVTHVADSKARHRLRAVRRRNPHALLVVTGCYAERAHREISRIEGIGLIAGNRHKPHLVKLVQKAGRPATADGSGTAVTGSGLRIRSFIRVQDGCDGACAYCIVPQVRGAARSRPGDEVLADVKDRVAEGYREMVLTGTEIGSYSHEGIGLVRLLQRILAETADVRLRLSSLQPQEILEGLLGLWRNERLCRHFHLSLQSGSDSVLRRMGRRYTVAEFRRAVASIREVVPDAAVTTDVIVGFPGETDAEFTQTLALCRELGFARIHVFPFSPRSGTGAARMPVPVSAVVKRQRSRQMLALAEEYARSFRSRFLGMSVPVLWEKRSGGVWSGLTDNYVRVYTRSSKDLTNSLCLAQFTELWRDGVWGQITRDD